MLIDAFILLVFLSISAVTFYFMRKWVMEYGNGKELPGNIICILILAALYFPLAMVKFIGLVLSTFMWML